MDGTNVTVVAGDATSMPFPDGSFSGAVCFTMLHHVPSAELQDRLLTETYRVLRPGGEWFISTPNLAYLRLTTLARKLKSLAGPGFAGERLKRWRAERIPYTPGAPVGHGQHIGLLTAGRLRRLARRRFFFARRQENGGERQREGGAARRAHDPRAHDPVQQGVRRGADCHRDPS